MAAVPRWGRRHTVLLLCFLAVFVGYTDRVNLAVAAVAMREEFGWSQTTKGVVLSGFAIGYLLFMAVGGWLANRYGGRRVMLAAIVAWSVFTLLTPASAYHSVALLIAARIALGMGEAPVFPSSYAIFARWIPSGERARAIALLYSGVPVGQVVGLVGTAWITSQYGWPVAFYAFGLLGLVLAVMWARLLRDDPARDPAVGPAERDLLARECVSGAGSPGAVPWRELLAHPPIWAIILGVFCSNWGLYFFLAWLPSYFAEALHLTVASAGIYSAAPWVAALVSTNAAAYFSDLAIRRGASPTLVRKVVLCGGLLLCGVFAALARDVGSPTLALVYVCASVGALGLTWAGYGPNLLDVTPRYASIVSGLSNTLGTLPGIAGVALVGWLVDATGTYATAFVLTAIVTIGGAVFYLVFGSAAPMREPQSVPRVD